MRQRFRQEAEEDIVKLALAIARRVLHRELTVAPDALLGLVKAALEKIEAREVHTRAHPAGGCRAMVRAIRGKDGTAASGWRWSRIQSLERGAAIFETSSRGASGRFGGNATSARLSAGWRMWFEGYDNISRRIMNGLAKIETCRWTGQCYGAGGSAGGIRWPRGRDRRFLRNPAPKLGG